MGAKNNRELFGEFEFAFIQFHISFVDIFSSLKVHFQFLSFARELGCSSRCRRVIVTEPVSARAYRKLIESVIFQNETYHEQAPLKTHIHSLTHIKEYLSINACI